MSSEVSAGKSYSISRVEGTVMEREQDAETKVNSRYDIHNNQHISSHTEYSTTLWIKKDNGKEINLTLQTQMKVRTGHRVALIYAENATSKEKLLMYVVNITTEDCMELVTPQIAVQNLKIAPQPSPVGLVSGIAAVIIGCGLAPKFMFGWDGFWPFALGAFGGLILTVPLLYIYLQLTRPRELENNLAQELNSLRDATLQL